MGLYFLDGATAGANSGALTAEQITSASSSITSSVNAVVNTFIELLPVIALTTGAIFAIRFIKGRFRKVEKQG